MQKTKRIKDKKKKRFQDLTWDACQEHLSIHSLESILDIAFIHLMMNNGKGHSLELCFLIGPIKIETVGMLHTKYSFMRAAWCSGLKLFSMLPSEHACFICKCYKKQDAVTIKLKYFANPGNRKQNTLPSVLTFFLFYIFVFKWIHL